MRDIDVIVVNCTDVFTCTDKNLDHYNNFGHPYIRKYGIGENFTWVLAMSPLMSEVLSRSECIEVDVHVITYNSCNELPYLFNVVACN